MHRLNGSSQWLTLVVFLTPLSLLSGVPLLRAQSQEPPATSQPAGPTTGDEAEEARYKSQTGDPEPPRGPDPSEILRALLKDGPGSAKPVLPPVRPGEVRTTRPAPSALPANAVVLPRQRLLPDGYRLVDRPGRLTQEADIYTFSFESRGQGAPELPLRLLPNRLLEDMEAVSAGGTKPVVFVISGEVTEYHGVNYMLVQKLLVRPDLGNIR